MSALTGGFTDPAIQSAQGFRILMDAMARPGSIHDLALAAPPAPLGRAAGTVLLLLADPTTPVHLAAPDPALAEWLRFHAGCPLSGPETAALAMGRWSDLQPLDRFSVGLPDYPDRSATLILELDRLENDGPRLTGPGIKDHARGIVAKLGVEAGFPLTPPASGHAFGLGCAECVEAVNERHTDVDFGRLPVRVS